MIFWAHVDAEGNIVMFGQSFGDDAFLQPLAEGLTAMARPQHVTGYSHRYDWPSETFVPL